MTTRRELIPVLGAVALLALPWSAGAQQAPKLPRIGVLWFAKASDPWVGRHMAIFRQRMRELGYIDGKTILIEERYSDGNPQRLSELAGELVASKVDLIVASAVAAALAAREATATIPIVMVHAGNPVGAGLIASLARPGGNVTGTTNLPLGGKLVEVMHELLPRATKLAVLVNPTNAGVRDRDGSALTAEAARGFGMGLVVVEVSRDEHFAGAYARIREARADALLVFVEPLIGKHRFELLEFVTGIRLPTGSDNGDTTRAGGLVSYGPLYSEHYVMAATYVDRLLKGTKPADLPVEQPTRFEVIVNLKTAKALGLAIPQSLLLRADEVIQ